MSRYLFFIFMLTVCSSFKAQLPINFKNPSFEGEPKTSVSDSIQMSMHWINCIDPENSFVSPYDIQPGSFKVILQPYDGESFIGMVTRVDGSYEGNMSRIG